MSHSVHLDSPAPDGAAQDAQHLDARARQRAIRKTLLMCTLLELLLLGLLFPMTQSLVPTVAWSLLILGPMTIWIAPALYDQFYWKFRH